MELDGVAAVQKNLAMQTQRYVEACKAAQLKMGTLIVERANRYVPVKSGTLKKSAYVRVRFSTKKGVFTNVGYTARHAAAIHKGVADRKTRAGKQYRVKLTPHSGSTRFLARAVKDFKAGYAEKMAMITKAYAASGVTMAQVANPYPYVPRVSKWGGFNKAIRAQIRAERKAKWGGFEREIRKSMRG